MEPGDIFLEGLPAAMRKYAIHSVREENAVVTKSGEQVIFKLHLNMEELSGAKRIGIRDLTGRLQDMEKDGIDAEICFPSLGLWIYALTDPQVELATVQVYNDWNSKFFANHLDRFVRCGVVPVRDLKEAQSELKRMASMGFTAAMMPSVTPRGVPKYNDPTWDPVFQTAAETGIVLVLHTGTGLDTVVRERGAGGAVINYAGQMNDGIDSITYLVAGGVLDRNPKAKVAVIECGASWLAALAERMDEVYEAHAPFVRPKLSLPPSGIIRRQVTASFQHDRACIVSRHITGHETIMWASDYPHAEGTFPHSRDVVAHLFDGIEISEREKLDILGGNALRLFRLPGKQAAAA
jgi:predicted TIM-barrel fold metal-dependent hydrolase